MELDRSLRIALTQPSSLHFITSDNPDGRSSTLKQLAALLDAPFLQLTPEQQRSAGTFLRTIGAALDASHPPREIAEHYDWIKAAVRSKGCAAFVIDGWSVADRSTCAAVVTLAKQLSLIMGLTSAARTRALRDGYIKGRLLIDRSLDHLVATGDLQLPGAEL